MRITQAGLPARALGGKDVRAAQRPQLRKLAGRRIVLLLDPEAEGDALRLADTLSDVRIAHLNGFADPGAATPAAILAAVRVAKRVSKARVGSLRSRLGEL
jgi:hypothetical protein